MMKPISYHLELVAEMKITKLRIHSTTCLQWHVLLYHLWRMVTYIQS